MDGEVTSDAGPLHVTGFSASEIVLSEVVQEVEAAVAASRLCSRALRVPELEALGVAGLAQHIFACQTCAAEEGGGPVGICEACALSCHVAHDVVDVGLRRDFLCDCGTTGRSAVSCSASSAPPAAAGSKAEESLSPETMPLPLLPPPLPPAVAAARAAHVNSYGHNFEGRFCVCDRAYAPEVDTLSQCLACSEWWHPAHTPGWLPGGDSGRIVCRRCVAKFPFIKVFAMRGPRDKCAGTESRLQPWTVCLTCTEGADDGRGICLACADACHAGHVLGKPRVSDFYCDCGELCAARASTGASDAATCTCKLAAQPATPPGAEPVSIAESGAVAVQSGSVSPASVAAPAPRWCASWPPASGAAEREAPVPDVTLFVDDSDALASCLCSCAACMRAYAAAGVASWFFGTPDWLPMYGGGGGSSAAEAAAASQGAPANAPSESAAIPAPAGQPALALSAAPAHSSEVVRVLLRGASASAVSPASAAALARLAELAPNLPPGFKTSFEQGISALGALPPAQQVDALTGYSEMSSSVMRWLEGLSSSGRATVTAEDVRTFFASLDGERRVRRRYE